MEIFNKILHSYAIYCRKGKCYLIPKKGYDTLSKSAIFFGQPCIFLDSLRTCCPPTALHKCDAKIRIQNIPLQMSREIEI